MLDINANQLIQLGEIVYFVWHCGFCPKNEHYFALYRELLTMWCFT